jgi:Acetyltransferases
MNIIIKECAHPDIEEVLALYSSVGWTNYTDKPEMLQSALENSLSVLGAFEGEKQVGILRAVGDGHSILYIQDIIVLPEYQRKGIGKALVEAIDEKFSHVYQKVLLTDDSPDSIPFYESCGLSLSSKLGCVAFVKFTV